MSSNLVIVALPADDDPTWKVSSEEKPHMTLLFLGDAESNPNVQRIIEFVQHAADVSEHGPFYMDIDHRGTLGSDEADVLFFRKGWSAKWITEFRNQLLQNTDIKTAYDSTTQYPEWTPHLTLGYPETPAHEDKVPEYGLNGVRFDRLAVWVNDFDGPELRLQWPEYEEGDMAVAWSEEVERGRQFAHAMALEHYGVKGMRWGVRKADEAGVKREGLQKFLDPQGHDLSTDVGKAIIGALVPVAKPFTLPAEIRLWRGAIRTVAANHAQKNQAKNLAKFERHAKSVNGFHAIHNGAAERINAQIDGINKKHPGDLTKSPAKQKAYDAEILKMMQAAYKDSANSITNKTGSHHLDVDFVNDGLDFKINVVPGPPKPTVEKIKHAAEDDTVTITARIQRDGDGKITGFKITDLGDASVTHTEESPSMYGAVFVDGLMHYGVKGMKWGFRKDSVPSAVAPSSTSRVPHGDKRKTKIKAVGGQNHPATPDALKVAEHRIKLAKSGPAALSNQELREVATRMQLEQQVKQLQTPAAKKFVRELLVGQGKQGVNAAVGSRVQRRLRVA
jgi:2'-5' RNA ligase